MTSDLSSRQISILQALWELKALGTHSVTIERLVSHLSEPPSVDTTEQLENLEKRSLITKSGSSDQASYSLSLLGTACVRQFQDGQLGDLGQNP